VHCSTAYRTQEHSPNITTPLESINWRGIDGKIRNVDVLFNRDYAKIHLIENFISENECQAIKDRVRNGLYAVNATNRAEESMPGHNPQAQQGIIAVPWNLKENLVNKVGQRIFEYTNQATWYNLGVEGQEDILIMMHDARGIGEKEPDRYIPHCDGDCSGHPQKTGNRVATMIMYCEVPEVGGATNFRNANVHVKAKKGNSIFFSYMGSDKVMDKGFTEHSFSNILSSNK